MTSSGERDANVEQEFFSGSNPGSEPEPGGPDADPMGIEQRRRERLGRRRVVGWVLFLSFLGFFGLLVGLLFDDLMYFVQPDEPLDLGLAHELRPRPLPHNRYVRIEGIARDMCIRADLFGERVRYLYLLGSELGARILIQAADPSPGECQGAEDRVFEGRMLDLAHAGRYGAVLAYYREHFPPAPAAGQMVLLLDGARPHGAWLFPAAALLLLGLAAVNGALLLRRRPQPRAQS